METVCYELENRAFAEQTLIKECQKEDPRIVLIDQENKGFSGARNVALDKSRGRAICFLDSDDMFEDGFLDLMYDGYVKSRSDYVTGQFTKMSEDGKIQGRQKGKRSHGGPCSRIYDRRIWESIRFPVDYWFEDTLLSIVLPRYKGSYIEAAGYLRRNRADSITHTASYEKKGLDTYWIIEEMLEWNRLLGFSVDQVIYDWLIVQMGPLMLSRTKALSDSDLKNLFYVCCDLFSSEVDGSLLSTSLSGKWLDIELALRSRNFDLWALSCAWL